jgi:hypothetical protein
MKLYAFAILALTLGLAGSLFWLGYSLARLLP